MIRITKFCVLEPGTAQELLEHVSRYIIKVKSRTDVIMIHKEEIEMGVIYAT